MSFDTEKPIEIQVEEIKATVVAQAKRVKELGEWPPYVQEESLVERIPGPTTKDAAGFDAGIACTLDLISREKQKLAATLHANYSPEAVQQVRDEMRDLDADSETCWWLAASHICGTNEGTIDQKKFLEQIADFKKLIADPNARKAAALEEYTTMTTKFGFSDEIGEGVPYGTVDGCMQGAYIKGYPFAVQYAKDYGIYFIGTYQPSLGLENFAWSDEKDEKGRPKSGPVWGSKQFVKCASLEELHKALEVVKQNFPEEK